MNTNVAQMSETAGGAATLPSISFDALRAALQAAGYRAEEVSDGNLRFLRSASNGLGFDVRPGNAFPGQSDQFSDIAFVAILGVQGTLPLDIVNKWNRTHRFSRLYVDKPQADAEFLVLSLDISLAGNVSPDYVRTQLQIWDTLIQQLIPWLREELGKLASSLDASAAAAEGAPARQASNG